MARFPFERLSRLTGIIAQLIMAFIKLREVRIPLARWLDIPKTLSSLRDTVGDFSFSGVSSLNSVR
jgi:hypothetical protein